MSLMNCVKLDGKIYCYDDEKDQVYEVSVMALDECPKQVLEAFIKNKACGTVLPAKE